MSGRSPFMWIDRRGSFHILAHTWFSGAWPLMTISGHAFSRDGISNWTFSHEEPYSYNVTYTSGVVEPFATIERPKLLFDRRGVPTHLFNGVSSQWPCNGTCAGVKTARGRDWTVKSLKTKNYKRRRASVASVICAARFSRFPQRRRDAGDSARQPDASSTGAG